MGLWMSCGLTEDSNCLLSGVGQKAKNEMRFFGVTRWVSYSHVRDSSEPFLTLMCLGRIPRGSPRRTREESPAVPRAGRYSQITRSRRGIVARRRQWEESRVCTRGIPRRKTTVLTGICSDEGGEPPHFHPEFGRFMLEATPAKPWGIDFKDLLKVESNMKRR